VALTEAAYRFIMLRKPTRSAASDARRMLVILEQLRTMTMQDHENSIPVAPGRTPWNKGKVIGAKSPLLDHVVALGEGHLCRILQSYAHYYNESRTHRALNKDAPVHRAIESLGAIISRPILDGLHHRYCRI
jgi:hypothetical protein